MIEHFDTVEQAKVRRNALLDASNFFELPTFLNRYTKASQEEGLRYRHKLYELVDSAQFPCDIDWPSPPIPQTIEDFNASLPKQEAIL